jgi:uncharacterized membrane protein YccC
MPRTWREEELRPKPTRADLEERLLNTTAEVERLEGAGYDSQSRQLRSAQQQRNRLKSAIDALTEYDKEAERRASEDGLNPLKLADRVPR